jgi:hypothetical protein
MRARSLDQHAHVSERARERAQRARSLECVSVRSHTSSDHTHEHTGCMRASKRQSSERCMDRGPAEGRRATSPVRGPAEGRRATSPWSPVHRGCCSGAPYAAFYTRKRKVFFSSLSAFSRSLEAARQASSKHRPSSRRSRLAMRRKRVHTGDTAAPCYCCGPPSIPTTPHVT